MDIGSIFLIIALAIVASIFVSRPFLEHRKDEVLSSPQETKQKEYQRSSLLAERDRILNSLQELEADFELGKIPHEDFAAQRERLLVSGAEVLKQLDAIKTEESRESQTKPVDPDDELEKLISNRRMSKESVTNFCPSCGSALHKGDQFCASCGNKIR